MIELQKALLYTHFTESRAYKTHLTYKDSHTIKVRAQKKYNPFKQRTYKEPAHDITQHTA